MLNAMLNDMLNAVKWVKSALADVSSKKFSISTSEPYVDTLYVDTLYRHADQN